MELKLSAILIALLIILSAIWSFTSWRYERKRQKSLAPLATEFELSFAHAPIRDIDKRYPQIELLRRSPHPIIFNVFSGNRIISCQEFHFVMCDVAFSGVGDRSARRQHSLLLVQFPWSEVPELHIRNETAADRVSAALGFDDIDFESAEFSRKFYVLSSNKQFAYNVISPAVMEHLLENHPCSYSIDLASGVLSVLYTPITHVGKYDKRRGLRWKADDFRRVHEFVTDFLELWPEHVLRDLHSTCG